MNPRIASMYERSRESVVSYLSRLWSSLSRFAAADTARELADLDVPPDISMHRMGSLVIRALPFMRPMFPHILFLILLGFFFSIVFTFTGALTGDVWLNKILNGERLQPVQAFVFFLDDSYVKPELLLEYEEERAREAEEREVSGFFETMGAFWTALTKGVDSDESEEETSQDDGDSEESEGAAESEPEVEPDVDVRWAEYLSEDCTTFVGEREGFHPALHLCEDQRRKVRNRSFAWFVVGGIIGIPLGLILPYYGAWIWQNVNHYLRVAMVERLEYLSLGFHHENRAGDAIFRIYQDSAQIVSVLDEVVIGPIEILRGLIIMMFFILLFSPLLLLVAFLCWIPMVLLTIWWTPRIRRRSVINRVLNSNLTSRTQEVFAALKIIKSNRAEKLMLDRFNSDSHRALDAALYLRFEMVMLSLIVALIGGVAIISMELLMIKWVLENRETAFGLLFVAIIGFNVWNLGAFNAANGRFGEAIGTGRRLVRIWSMWQDLFIGLERAFYFLQLQPSVLNPATPVPYPETVDSVSWNNVHFSYEEGKPVLQGVNLKADAGTITAIVGSTGSGKSTIMSMLLRLYDPDDGSVMINDIDLKSLEIDDLRANTAIALQKNVLFTGKVGDNIGYALVNATDEQIEAAARVACAHEFIEELEEGYNTELGDRGSKLSAGQRQRITIARAIIRDTAILILDEPTASLDAQTEHDVLRNLSEWGRDRVVFLITHRLSTIQSVDRIAFLEDGQLVEVGSHEELMAIPDGRYRDFVTAETIGTGGVAGESA